MDNVSNAAKNKEALKECFKNIEPVGDELKRHVVALQLAIGSAGNMEKMGNISFYISTPKDSFDSMTVNGLTLNPVSDAAFKHAFNCDEKDTLFEYHKENDRFFMTAVMPNPMNGQLTEFKVEFIFEETK